MKNKKTGARTPKLSNVIDVTYKKEEWDKFWKDVEETGSGYIEFSDPRSTVHPPYRIWVEPEYKV